MENKACATKAEWDRTILSSQYLNPAKCQTPQAPNTKVVNWQGFANAEYTSIASEIESCVSTEHLFRLPKQTSQTQNRQAHQTRTSRTVMENCTEHLEACTEVRKLTTDARQAKWEESQRNLSCAATL